MDKAISIGRQIEDLQALVGKKSSPRDDYGASPKSPARSIMPVCAGGSIYRIAPHRQTLAHHSVDIVMIDVLRAGGITQWMKIAGMAEAFDQSQVVSHLLPELHVHLIAAAPNGQVVEYMPWTFHLFYIFNVGPDQRQRGWRGTISVTF